jgi:hypothetical protein
MLVFWSRFERRPAGPALQEMSMEHAIKTKRRTFRLENRIDQYGPDYPGPHKWVEEVLSTIERDELLVFDPQDKDVLQSVFNSQGEEPLEAKATLPVLLREWLPVGCQCIRWFDSREEKEEKSGAVGCYQHNAFTILWPPGIRTSSQGPAAFVGEIAMKFMVDSEDRFKCVLAHELVHVFDMLKLLVPAFTNWRTFYTNVLDGGLANEDAGRRHRDIGIFIDDYGGECERLRLVDYWPSQADRWFKAFRESPRAGGPAWRLGD